MKKDKGWYFEEKLQFVIRNGQEDTVMEKGEEKVRKQNYNSDLIKNSLYIENIKALQVGPVLFKLEKLY